MKHLIRRLSASQLDVVGYASIGDNSISLTQRGSSIKSFLNGYEIYNISYKNPWAKDSGVVLASVINNILNSSNENKVRLYKSEWKSLRDSSLNLLDNIESNLSESILVIKNKPKYERDTSLKVAPGFTVENGISEKGMQKNLFILKNKINELAINLEGSLDTAKSFTRIKLRDTMWGAKEMQKILDNLRSEFMANYWKKAEISFEVLDKSISRLINKINFKLLNQCGEEKKIITSILIPNIVSSYEKIKETAIKMVTLLAPLIVIDKTFTDKTSYPARFFISDEIIDQIQNKFDNLIKFLCLAPVIESKVLDPLDFVRMQMINEIKEA